MTASRRLLQGLLREELGFEGVVVSDYGAIGNTHTVQHMGETLEEAALRCMTDGTDVELPSAVGYSETLKEMFASGAADMAILDRAVLRVLTAKYRMGLFEAPFALEGEELRRAFYQTGAKELSLRSALESLVLLKNDGALPLSQKIRRLAVIGPHAADAGKFFGGYTHLSMAQSVFAAQSSIAGLDGTGGQDGVVYVPGTKIQSDETEQFQKVRRLQQPDCPSLLEYLRKALPDTEITYAKGYEIAGDFEGGFEEALEAVRQADAVILTLGGRYGTCSIASTGEGVDVAMEESCWIGLVTIAFVKQFDEAMAQTLALYRQGQLEIRKQERLEEEKAHQAEEAAAAEELRKEKQAQRDAFFGWADGMSELRFGQVRKIMEQKRRYDGVVMTRREFMIHLVKEGRTPVCVELDATTEYHLTD